MGLEPRVVAPGRVRQRQVARQRVALQDLAPAGDCGRDALRCFSTQMPALRVAADEQHQLDLPQMLEEARPPFRGAFAARRKIGTARILAGIAKAHGHDRDAAHVVELFCRHAHPVPQPLARRIAEGNAGGVHARARRLPHNCEPRAAADAQNGARLVRERGTGGRLHAKPTGADLIQQAIEARGHALLAQMSSVMPSSARRTLGSRTCARCASISALMCVSITRLAPRRSRFVSMFRQVIW